MKITIWVSVFITILLLISCSQAELIDEDWDLTAEGFMETYTRDKRLVNLSESWLEWFVSLNGLNGETEIVNIDVSDNAIEVLNITQYPNLLRLVADNNNFVYFTDIKFPENIKHLSLANNMLENLEGIENLKNLISIDISGNNLDEDDFQALEGMDTLRYIEATGNNLSEEFQIGLFNYNQRYLAEIQWADPTKY